MIANAIMGLLPRELPVLGGKIDLQGIDLLTQTPAQLRSLRGSRMGMVFQEPMAALNPLMRIGDQIAEVFYVHGLPGKPQQIIDLLRAVNLPDPEALIHVYPHMLSGGQRQRVVIAMAIALEPALLIADEPTTALDVTTQAQILNLIDKLQDDFGSAVIMITHDLGVIAEIADDVVVMYAAEVAEQAPVDNLFKRPAHPYTWGLLGSLPRLDADVERLVQIQGSPPSLLNPPRGCRFNPRCPYVMPVCKEQDPPLAPVRDEPEHTTACWLDQETKDREAAKLLAGMMAEAS
jgi:oligopeptide/dipeptide ABC transporter ATP-binding protein